MATLSWTTHFNEGREIINKHITEWGHKHREEKPREQAWGHEELPVVRYT